MNKCFVRLASAFSDKTFQKKYVEENSETWVWGILLGKAEHSLSSGNLWENTSHDDLHTDKLCTAHIVY